MRKLIIVAAFVFVIQSVFSQNIHHSFSVNINVKGQQLDVIDKMLLPVNYIQNKKSITFALSKKFSVKVLNNTFSIEKNEEQHNIINNYFNKNILKYIDDIKSKYSDKEIMDTIKIYAKDNNKNISDIDIIEIINSSAGFDGWFKSIHKY